MSNSDEEILSKQKEIDEVKKYRKPCNGTDEFCACISFYNEKEKEIKTNKSKKSPVVELGNKQEDEYISIPAHDSSIER